MKKMNSPLYWVALGVLSLLAPLAQADIILTPGGVVATASNPFIGRPINQYYNGYNQLSLRNLLDINWQFRGLDIEYVEIRLRSDTYQGSVALLLNGYTEDQQALQSNLMTTVYLSAPGRNDRVDSDIGDITVALSGNIFVESVGIKFQDTFYYPPRPMPPPYNPYPRDPYPRHPYPPYNPPHRPYPPYNPPHRPQPPHRPAPPYNPPHRPQPPHHPGNPPGRPGNPPGRPGNPPRPQPGHPGNPGHGGGDHGGGDHSRPHR